MPPQTPRFFDYNKKLIDRARENRKEMTLAERRMWYDIIPNLNIRVMRQRVIGNYITVFYCASRKLVIEIDGIRISQMTHRNMTGFARITLNHWEYEWSGIQMMMFMEIQMRF
jgi:very-short-patch-repair endonuclease